MTGKRLNCEKKLAEKGYNAIVVHIDYVLPGITVETFIDLNTAKVYTATTMDGEVVGLAETY